GYGWLFPRGGEANLGIGAAQSARSRLKPMLEALHRRLCKEGRVGAEVLGLTGGAIPVGGMVPPVGSIGVLPVLLAGDAAGLANPVTGAGIASAVQSGQLAGRAAADWCRGHRPALEEYVSELEEIFGP